MPAIITASTERVLLEQVKSGVPGDPMKKRKICTDAPHRVMLCAVSPMWSGHDMVPQENQVRFVLLEEWVFANAQHPERGHLA